MNYRIKNKVGFTLVELSIVLVIIGLVIGGVMVGSVNFTVPTLLNVSSSTLSRISKMIVFTRPAQGQTGGTSSGKSNSNSVRGPQ